MIKVEIIERQAETPSKKKQVGNDQEKSQLERNSQSKNRGGTMNWQLSIYT